MCKKHTFRMNPIFICILQYAVFVSLIRYVILKELLNHHHWKMTESDELLIGYNTKAIRNRINIACNVSFQMLM